MFISKKDYNRLSDLKDYIGFIDTDSYPFQVLADITSNIELYRIKHNYQQDSYFKKGV